MIEIGGKNGGIMVEENVIKNTISHRESRHDTTASIIQINTINEQNTNKSTSSLLGNFLQSSLLAPFLATIGVLLT